MRSVGLSTRVEKPVLHYLQQDSPGAGSDSCSHFNGPSAGGLTLWIEFEVLPGRIPPFDQFFNHFAEVRPAIASNPDRRF